MTWLLGLLTGSSWVKWALYAAIAATVFVGGYQLSALYYKAKIARIDAEIAQVEAMRAEEARKATEANRKKEQEAQAVVDELAKRYVDEQAKLDESIAASRVLANRLRDALKSTNSGGTPGDPGPSAAVDDPRVLALLLVAFDEFAGMCAEGADKARSKIAGLQVYIESIRK
jgi:hypothetical protein